jgi:hypothetical protein
MALYGMKVAVCPKHVELILEINKTVIVAFRWLLNNMGGGGGPKTGFICFRIGKTVGLL